MRRFLVRLLACISGAFLGFAIAWTLSAVEELLLGAGQQTTFALVNAALLILAWLSLRGRLAPSLAFRVTAACAVVAVVLLSGLELVRGFAGNKFDASDLAPDLRRLVAAQDQFHRDSGRYSPTPPVGYTPSHGQTNVQITPTADGWQATITRAGVIGVCVVYVGSTPITMATREREPVCTKTASGATDPDLVPWIVTLLVLATIFGGVAKWLDRPLQLQQRTAAT